MSLLLSSSLLSDSSAFPSSNRGCFREQCSGQAGDIGTVADLLHSNRQVTKHHCASQSRDALQTFCKNWEFVKPAGLLKKLTATSSNLNLHLASAGCSLVHSMLPSAPKVVQCHSVTVLRSGKGCISMTCRSLHHLETAVGPSRWQTEYINLCHENLIHMKVINCLCIKQAGLIHQHSGLNRTRIQAHRAHSELSFGCYNQKQLNRIIKCSYAIWIEYANTPATALLKQPAPLRSKSNSIIRSQP